MNTVPYELWDLETGNCLGAYPDETTALAEVRALLANPKVQMVLLTDGSAFRGAVTQIPAEVSPRDRAVNYVDADAETISPDASDDEAFERAAANPTRRVIVLDEDDNLLGLLCLNQNRTKFCRS